MLAALIKDQIGTEAEELAESRVRVKEEEENLETTISNLLDNISEANREFVDDRLGALKKQHDCLNLRSDELERLELSQASIDGTVDDAMEWLSKLEFILRHGIPQEKLVALRQCVQRIWIGQASRIAEDGHQPCAGFKHPSNRATRVEANSRSPRVGKADMNPESLCLRAENTCGPKVFFRC